MTESKSAHDELRRDSHFDESEKVIAVLGRLQNARLQKLVDENDLTIATFDGLPFAVAEEGRGVLSCDSTGK
jgi:hypothetical protein